MTEQNLTPEMMRALMAALDTDPTPHGVAFTAGDVRALMDAWRVRSCPKCGEELTDD